LYRKNIVTKKLGTLAEGPLVYSVYQTL